MSNYKQKLEMAMNILEDYHEEMPMEIYSQVGDIICQLHDLVD